MFVVDNASLKLFQVLTIGFHAHAKAEKPGGCTFAKPAAAVPS
jgi:hypothetical protein